MTDMPSHPPSVPPSCALLTPIGAPPTRLPIYRMAAAAPLYARPVIVRGEQCARGATWPLAERPSSCLVVQRQSRAGGWPHRQAVMLAKCRVCRPQQHGSPSERRRSAQDVRMPTVALVALSASACPASARPVSGIRCVSSVRPSGVQCPVSAHAGVHASAVQCRVRTSSVPRRCPRVPRPRPPCLHPRLSWSASERGLPHGQEGAQVWRPLYPRTARPSASAKWPLVRRAWRRIGRVAQIRGGDYAPWSSWEPGAEAPGLWGTF